MFLNESSLRLHKLTTSPSYFEEEFSAATPEEKERARTTLNRWKDAGFPTPKVSSSFRGIQLVDKLAETLN